MCKKYCNFCLVEFERKQVVPLPLKRRMPSGISYEIKEIFGCNGCLEKIKAALSGR